MAITRNFNGLDVRFGTATPPAFTPKEVGAQYFVTGDGTSAATISEQWIYSKDGWVEIEVINPSPVATSHNALSDRSIADQHPISAITGLQAELDRIIDNVSITSPVANQAIVWNGTAWVNSAVPAPSLTLNDLTNVDTVSPVADNFLKFDGTKWTNSPAAAPSLTLNDLTNVETAAPATGHYLRYNGTQWANQAFPTIPTLSSNLTDFSTYGYADNTIPFWDTATSKWKALTPVTAGHVLKMGSSEPEFGALNIDALSDVAITTPTTGQVLQWNGTNWINSTFSVLNTDQTVINTSGNGGLSFNSSTSNVAVFTPTGSITSLNWTSVTASTVTDKASSLVLVIRQGATAYMPSSYQINSSVVTVRWAGNVTPATGKANGVDVITLNVIRAGSVYTVFGQHVSFG